MRCVAFSGMCFVVAVWCPLVDWTIICWGMPLTIDSHAAASNLRLL